MTHWSATHSTARSKRRLSRLQLHMHPLAQVRSNVDQRIERKARDTPTQQLIDARLRDAALLGRFKLRPSFALNQRRNFVRQFRAKAQVGGFLWRVSDGVPHAGVAVDFWLGHLLPLVNWAKRVLAVSMSRGDVVGVFF